MNDRQVQFDCLATSIMTGAGNDVSTVAAAIVDGRFHCQAVSKIYDPKQSRWARPFVVPVVSLQGMSFEERLYALAKQTLLPLLETIAAPLQLHWCLPRSLAPAAECFYRGLPALLGLQAVFHPVEMGFMDLVTRLQLPADDGVIIIGSAVSYLERADIQQQLQQQTLMTATMTEGVPPGEGAGFIVVKSLKGGNKQPLSTMQYIGYINAEELALLVQKTRSQVFLPTYGCPTTVKAWHNVRRFCQRLSVNNTQVFMPALMSAKNQLGYLGVAAWPIVLSVARHMSQQLRQPMLVCDAVDETQFEVVYVCG